MAARAGGYYGKAFKGARGVTQGDPLSPTIFNVVVDAVVRHWIEGLITETKEKGETGREGRHQSAVFYADDGMVGMLPSLIGILICSMSSTFTLMQWSQVWEQRLPQSLLD